MGGTAMNSDLVQKGVLAHHQAIASTNNPGHLLSKIEFENINAAIGRMIASVPESMTMDVYNAFAPLVSPDVPPYLMSTVNQADAQAAYSALMEFKDVVKAHPINPAAPTVGKIGKVVGRGVTDLDAAAAKLSKAAYPFVKSVDWTSDISLKPLPGASPNDVLQAIDKALVMGGAMEGKYLKEAGEAHHKAIVGSDAKLVASAADFAAINAALGKAIATVPTGQVMDVYNAFAKIVDPVVPNFLFQTVSQGDAQAAYLALMKFKDVVRAAHTGMNIEAALEAPVR